jgi:hypothetical protein
VFIARRRPAQVQAASNYFNQVPRGAHHPHNDVLSLGCGANRTTAASSRRSTPRRATAARSGRRAWPTGRWGHSPTPRSVSFDIPSFPVQQRAACRRTTVLHRPCDDGSSAAWCASGTSVTAPRARGQACLGGAAGPFASAELAQRALWWCARARCDAPVARAAPTTILHCTYSYCTHCCTCSAAPQSCAHLQVPRRLPSFYGAATGPPTV